MPTFNMPDNFAPVTASGGAPAALTLSVGGFQVVEVSSEQLAMLQPVPTPSASNTASASEPNDSTSQDDAAVRQMVRSTPDTLGRVSLFVIDGGIRLPLAAQEERAPQSANANSPALQRPQDREDSLQQKDQ
jgi:hypothetical protein